jgi:hypothetical protein
LFKSKILNAVVNNANKNNKEIIAVLIVLFGCLNSFWRDAMELAFSSCG